MIRSEEETLMEEKTKHLRTFILISLVSFSFATFQLGIFRELRYHVFPVHPNVYFALSLAYMGIGVRFADNSKFFRYALLSLPLLIFISCVSIIYLDFNLQRPGYSGIGWITIPIFSSPLYGISCFMYGVLIAFLLQGAKERGKLPLAYAIDLFVLGVSELLASFLVLILNPLTMIALSMFMISIAMIMSSLVSIRYSSISLILPFLLFSGVIDDRNIEDVDFSIWSPYRKIDVRYDDRSVYLFSDSILWYYFLRPADNNVKNSSDDIRVIPYLISYKVNHNPQKILIIGSGIGIDVYIARDIFPYSEIVSVEIDPGIINAAEKIPWLWQRYKTSHIFVGNGAYFLKKNHNEKFDLIFFSFVDPGARISLLGFPDEEPLYTVESLRNTFRKLNTYGMIIITRVFASKLEEKFFGTLCATLSEAEIQNFRIYSSRTFLSAGFELKIMLLFIFKKLQWESIYPELSKDEKIYYLLHSEVLCEDRNDNKPSTVKRPFTFAFYDIPYYSIFIFIPLMFISTLSGRRTGVSFFLMGFSGILAEAISVYLGVSHFRNPFFGASFCLGLFLISGGISSAFVKLLGRKSVIFSFMLIPAFMSSDPIFVSLSMGFASSWLFPLSLEMKRDKKIFLPFFWDILGCVSAPFMFWFIFMQMGIDAVKVLVALTFMVAILGSLLASRTENR